MKIRSLTASPDAALLTLMRQIEMAEERHDRVLSLSSAMKPDTDKAYDELHHLVRQACAVPAKTDEGKVAKARLFQSFNCYIGDDGTMQEDTDIMIQIAHSLSIDLAGPPLPHCEA